MDTSIRIRALAARWLALDCAANPLTAAWLGIPGLAGRLADHSPDARRRHQQERLQILAELEQLKPRPLSPDQLELTLLRADVHRACLEHELEPCAAPHTSTSKRSGRPCTCS